MNYQFTFTVFTPTYNRAQTLHRVYDSLKLQTFHDFEWLIVDDGSTDDTKELVQKWIQEEKFPIRYIWQENQQKKGAFNHGVQKAQGELFLTLDSDDACVPEALEILIKYWNLIPLDQQDQFSAVTCLCKDQHGKLVGTKFPKDITDCDLHELRYKYKVKGEKWGFQRTEVLKQFPFPGVEEKGHVPPGWLWNAISREYKTRFINEVLRIYYVNESDRSDQLSKTTKTFKQFGGMLLASHTALNKDIHWFPYAPLEFLRTAIHYSRFCFHGQVGLVDQFKKLDNPLAKFLWVAMLPAGFIVYMRDKQLHQP